MRIIDVVADSPGGYSHYTIWKNSTVRNMFEKGLIPKKHFLIADSTYPLELWLMTPYDEVNTPRQQQYNALHQNSLRIIRKCIYHLKSQFKILKQDVGFKLLYTPDKVSKIILACCILYNICLKYNTDEDDSDMLDEEIDNTITNEINSGDIVPEDLAEQGFVLRSEIASEL